MKILFVGRHPKARALFRLLCGTDRKAVMHSANSLDSVRLLLETGNCYDFAIINGAESSSGSAAMVDALRRANPEVAIAYLSMEGEMLPRPKSLPRLLGAFEKGSRGQRVLNCALASPSGAAEGNCALDLGEFIFEYQAPCPSKSGVAP